jgi:hypothetical protein
MQYLVIENFRGRDPVPVYRRFRDRGRLAPDGLKYVGSWITEDLARCYQVMECADGVFWSSGSRSGAIWSTLKCCQSCRQLKCKRDWLVVCERAA